MARSKKASVTRVANFGGKAQAETVDDDTGDTTTSDPIVTTDASSSDVPHQDEAIDTPPPPPLGSSPSDERAYRIKILEWLRDRGERKDAAINIADIVAATHACTEDEGCKEYVKRVIFSFMCVFAWFYPCFIMNFKI